MIKLVKIGLVLLVVFFCVFVVYLSRDKQADLPNNIQDKLSPDKKNSKKPSIRRVPLRKNYDIEQQSVPGENDVQLDDSFGPGVNDVQLDDSFGPGVKEMQLDESSDSRANGE